MDAKIVPVIIIFSLVAIIAGIMIPTDNTADNQQFPWQITHTTQGNTQVFGLVLQVSSLGEMAQRFNTAAEVSLFSDKNQHRTVEAFFDKVALGGLNAKVVAVLNIGPQQLDTFYSQGSRISALGDGRNKITLRPDDLAGLNNSTIKSIAYLPSVALDDQLLLGRFGPPSQKVREKDNGTRHWLYPNLGLDIARNAENKAVLQYVVPTEFSQLIEPLILDKNARP